MHLLSGIYMSKKGEFRGLCYRVDNKSVHEMDMFFFNVSGVEVFYFNRRDFGEGCIE